MVRFLKNIWCKSDRARNLETLNKDSYSEALDLVKKEVGELKKEEVFAMRRFRDAVQKAKTINTVKVQLKEGKDIATRKQGE